MIRVLVIMDSTGAGGAETSMAALAPWMRGLGVELEVAYFVDRDGVRDRFVEAGITLWHVRPGASRIVTVSRVTNLIRKRQPDLVHTMIFESDVIGRPAAFLARVPVISSIISDIYSDEFLSAAPSRLRIRLGQLLDAMTAQLIDGFHAVSIHTATNVPRRLGARRKPVTVIYRGRDLSSFQSIEYDERTLIRSGLGIELDTKLLVLVCRHAHMKGIETAIQALHIGGGKLGSAHLLVVGAYSGITSELKKLIKTLRLEGRVHMIGHQQEVARLMGASDVALCTSLWEGFPGSALESMLCGLPLVASNIPPLRELAAVTDPSGVLFFRSGDPSDLASQLKIALEIEAATRAKSDWRGQFSAEAAADRFAQLYYAVVARRQAGRSKRG